MLGTHNGKITVVNRRKNYSRTNKRLIAEGVFFKEELGGLDANGKDAATRKNSINS